MALIAHDYDDSDVLARQYFGGHTTLALGLGCPHIQGRVTHGALMNVGRSIAVLRAAGAISDLTQAVGQRQAAYQLHLDGPVDMADP
ncbi:MAG: hypothetical protein LBJ62_05745 [Bifidobacteriaceae bacterium]|nr:hypothetical protein [Bifidobacteriaceae bacterium]